MPKTKEQKQKEIEELKKIIKNQKSMVFIDYKNLKSDVLFKIKNSLKEKDNKLKIIKKTLFQKALNSLKLHKVSKYLNNIKTQLGVVFSLNDELGAIKDSINFSKQYENFKILGGFFENEILDQEKIKVLSSLPSKQELLGKLTYTIKNPISNLVFALNFNLEKFILVLNQIKDKKQN
ncbi:MAG: 50S ribosomal protein L10 [Minisyncoccia bacterium]